MTNTTEMVSIAGNRLDAFVARAFHLSRSLAMQAFKGGYVTVNGVRTVKATRAVAAGDVVAVEGYGAAVVHTIAIHAKSHRTHVTFAREAPKRA